MDADPDNTVLTWEQYCAMLGRAIKLHDENDYPEWQKITKKAPDTEMKRDGAMVSLLFAAKTMGYASFNASSPAEFNDYAPEVWDVVTMDYPVFDWNTPITLSDECSDNNHVGPAYDFCLRRVSFESNKSLLEFDAAGDLPFHYVDELIIFMEMQVVVHIIVHKHIVGMVAHRIVRLVKDWHISSKRQIIISAIF